MLGGQAGIVAPNFATSSFGMCKEVEIVHRNHLGRMARWQQQRVEGVRDVKIAAGERLHGRPPEPVPCEVQDANRNPAVDSDGTAELGRIGETILPGARKNREGSAACGRAQEPGARNAPGAG